MNDITQASVELLFTYNCSTYTHTSCETVALNISTLCNKGVVLDNTFLLKYFLYLTKPTSYYRCHDKASIWTSAVSSICDKTTPTLDNIKYIVSGNALAIPIFEKLIERGVKIESIVLETAIEKNYYVLIEFLLNHVVATSDMLEKLCLNNSYAYDKIIMNMLNQKIQITSKCLQNAISLKKHAVIDLLIQYGGEIDQDSLVAACKIRDSTIISRLLQCRIMPEEKSFQAIFVNIFCGNYNGHNTDSHGQFLYSKPVADIIDLLINAGYVLKYEDVLFALKKRCFVNNINRFKIKYQPEFMEICSTLGYYPYNESVLNILPTIKCMYIECGKHNNILRIKLLIEKGLTPDLECLRTASSLNNNGPVIKLLIDKYGIIPDVQCLKNSIKTLRNNNLDILLNHIKDPPLVKKTAIKKVSIKKTSIKKTSIKKTSIKESIKKTSIKESIKKTNGKKTVNKKKSKSKMNELMNELELSEEFNDFGINKDKETEKEVKTEVTEMKLLMSIKAPTNKRTKNIIDVKILTFLKLKKGMKLSFIDLRKKLVDYVMKNKLCKKEETKTIINPDKSMCESLKLEHNKYIDFTNFDTLVSRCYN